MSTKISIADTPEWELFERMWDNQDTIRLSGASLRIGDGWTDAADKPLPDDAEIILPKKWLREFVAGMDEHERKEAEANAIARAILAKRGEP